MSIAVVHVDIQGAFMGKAPLGGKDRYKVIAPSVELSGHEAVDRVYASHDKHPADHMSYNIWPRDDEGRTIHPRLPHDTPDINMWPVHGVADTPEADIDPQILAVTDEVIPKGMDRDVEQYSAASEGTGLIDSLREHGMTTVIVTGLCTDYCVKNTAIDLAAAGFNIVVPLDCIQGVELSPGDCDRAIEAMEAAGVTIASTHEQAIETALSFSPGHSL